MATVNPVEAQRFLGGVDYPANVTDLVDAARTAGADDTVIATLQALPDDDFETPADVSEAIGDLNDASWSDGSVDPSVHVDDDEIDMDEEDGDI